jgi:hypothetical protein
MTYALVSLRCVAERCLTGSAGHELQTGLLGTPSRLQNRFALTKICKLLNGRPQRQQRTGQQTTEQRGVQVKRAA